MPTFPAKEVTPVFVNAFAASSRAMFEESERPVDGIAMLAEPLNETPAMVLAVVNVAEDPVVF
jgi:hypothetical protein